MKEGAEGGRILGLDAIRGLAALTVLFSHSGSWIQSLAWEPIGPLLSANVIATKLLRGGATGSHPGVVAFIVLSGFCIHLPLAQDSGRRHVSGFWATFARRRSLRLLPVYWFCCLAGAGALAVSHALAVPIDFTPNEWTWLALLLKLTTLSAWLPTEASVGNHALRTVAVEFWLYAAYPAAIWLRYSYGWRNVIPLGVASWTVAFIAQANGAFHLGHESFFFFLPLWLLGAFSAEAALSSVTTPVVSFMNRWRTIAALVALNAGLCLVEFRGDYAPKTAILATVVSLVLIRIYQGELQAHGPRKPVRRATAWYGERSYSLYAIHTPVLVLGAVAANWIVLGQTAVVVAAGLAGLALYSCIEAPSHAWAKGRRSSTSRLAAATN